RVDAPIDAAGQQLQQARDQLDQLGPASDDYPKYGETDGLTTLTNQLAILRTDVTPGATYDTYFCGNDFYSAGGYDATKFRQSMAEHLKDADAVDAAATHLQDMITANPDATPVGNGVVAEAHAVAGTTRADVKTLQAAWIDEVSKAKKIR